MVWGRLIKFHFLWKAFHILFQFLSFLLISAFFLSTLKGGVLEG